MMTTTQTTTPKTMAAKFAGRCACGCGASIAVGKRIEWSRATGARLIGHTTRTTTPVTEVALGIVRVSRPARTVRRHGRWTGCSCGSREDAAGDLIPSPRNCASCEHDA